MKPEDKKYILENMGKKSLKEIARALNLKDRKIKKFLDKKKKGAMPAGSEKKERPALSMRVIIISIVLIAIIGVISYLNTTNGEFIWDDYYLIKDNTFIKSTNHIADIFKTDIAAGSGKKASSYRPLQILTYMFDYSFWKLDQRGYHITNILLHILAALSIYWLINILYDNRFLSFLTSALFVTHPIHTEAVSYISGRADPLAVIFLILAFILYVKYIDLRKSFYFVLMLLSYILALFSRESSFIFPVLLVLYHYSFKKKFNIAGIASVSVVTFIYLLIRATALRETMPHLMSETTMLQRLPGAFVAITNYIRLMILPLNLHMEYGFKTFNMADPKAILGIALLIIFFSYAFMNRKNNSIVFFSISWFFLALMPSLNLYPLNAYMAEHWLYLPSIGFFLLFAGGLDYAYRNKVFKTPVVIFAIILVASYTYATVKQNEQWKEAFSFYKRTLKYSPNNIRVLNSLGLLYHENNKPDEAIRAYRKAIEISPDYIDAYNNLGIVYRNLKKPEEAIAIYKKAIEMNPDFVYTYCNLANAYKDIGRKEEAISLYKKAIEIYPNFSYAYNNLGLSYKDFGRIDEAIASYKKAIELKPNYMEAYNNLGALYFNMGRKEEALFMFEKAVEIDPFNAKSYSNLGASYTDAGRRKEAIPAFKKALQIDPGYAMVHYNLAVTYFHEKQYSMALRHYDRAVGLGYEDDSNFSQVIAPYRRLPQ
ncbi:MAG: tetratricopeptide repeat protein [Candidatus Omnitrophota bacterium]